MATVSFTDVNDEVRTFDNAEIIGVMGGHLIVRTMGETQGNLTTGEEHGIPLTAIKALEVLDEGGNSETLDAAQNLGLVEVDFSKYDDEGFPVNA